MTKKQISMVTLSLLLANIMAGLDATIINTAIPAIVSDLKGIQYMGWIVACFLLGMSVSVPIWSKIGERMGNKFAFELSLALFWGFSFGRCCTRYLLFPRLASPHGSGSWWHGFSSLCNCRLYLS